MSWHTGLHRLSIVGTVAFLLGILSCASVLITRSLGYGPDASVASLFAVMWPAGVVLIALGGLLWVAVWVLHGFAPPVPALAREDDAVPRRAHLDP